MELLKIQNISQYRETHTIEAKKAQGGLPASLWETYSAFTNTDGGTVLLGVEELDDHSLRVIGLKDAVKMEKDFWNKANSRQTISVNLLTNKMVRIESVDGKDILVIEVPRAERTMKPVYKGQEPKNGTYRRNGEGDYLCSLEEVSAMYRDAALSSMDTKVLKEMDYNVFCQESIKSYRQVFNGLHPTHVWRDLEDEVFLRRLGAIGVADDGTLHPTSAGLLMFGNEYDIVREFPHYFLDYQENRQLGPTRWTDRITSSNGEWSGNVYDFIYKVTPKLCSDLKVPFVLQGMSRVDDTPLHKLIREAVTNCCAHADFYGRRGLVIQKTKDTFTFSNPGGLRVSKQEAVDGGISDPRNETLLKMLSMINYGERAGSGMNGIFMVWEKVYGCKPTFDEQIGVDRMVLTLDTQGKEPNMDALISLYGMEHHGVTDDKPAINEGNQGKNGELSLVTRDKTGDKPTINAESDDKPTVNEGKQGIKSELSLVTRDKADEQAVLSSETRDIIESIQGINKKTRDNLFEIAIHIKTHAEARNADIVRLCNVSDDRARVLLATLVEHNVLKAEGANKNRTYSLKK